MKKRTNKLKDKKIDESWDFRKSNTKEFTHCFHSYPAMMIPQVARRIIDNFGNKSKILFDPYCGTGTSLVEANLKGINAIGTDINPLARLIAITKTTKTDIQILDLFLYDFMNYFFSINFNIETPKSLIIPQIKNIDFWFSKSVQKQLGVLLGYIENINDIKVSKFLGTVPYPYKKKDAKWFINHQKKEAKKKPRTIYNFSIIDKETNKLIGGIRIDINREHKRGALGY